MCVRVAPRQREQPLRARPGESVDRLVVVADGAELVSIAKPEIEQRLLQQIDVLILVDRECLPPLAHQLERVRVRFEHLDRPLEQVLEVEGAGLGLSLLVLAKDAMREVGRQRRLVVAECSDVRLRCQPAVLRPLDLGREIARRAELVRRGKPVADLPQQQRLRRENPPRIAGKATEQGPAPRSGRSTRARPRRRAPPVVARSSPAALSVNVTATSSGAANAPLATCQAIRRVIVVVLPVPAPARMQTGPRVASTAARCSGFSPAKIRSASKDGPP